MLFVVATPIGNLGDMSPRAIETLKNSDYILVEDTRQTIKLLNHFDIKVKMLSYHKFNEKERTASVIEDLKKGKNISLVCDAGTPCISDPGYILVREARNNEVQVIGIPGPSAVITALSIGGLNTESFVFYGFVPTDNKQRRKLFDSIRTSDIKTKVVYESPKRIVKFLSDLSSEVPECEVSICSELTKIHEKCVFGSIGNVYNQIKDDKTYEKGEYVVLISNNMQKDNEKSLSIEASLIDIMVKKGCTLKEAVDILNKTNDNLRKKDIYNASLNIKNVIK